MAISGIDLVSNGINALPTNTKVMNGDTDNTTSFDALLDSVMSMYEEANTYQKEAEEAELNFALGYSTSTHDLALAQQKANIALSYTTRVTNKAIEAYKELMNMQI